MFQISLVFYSRSPHWQPALAACKHGLVILHEFHAFDGFVTFIVFICSKKLHPDTIPNLNLSKLFKTLDGTVRQFNAIARDVYKQKVKQSLEISDIHLNLKVKVVFKLTEYLFAPVWCFEWHGVAWKQKMKKWEKQDYSLVFFLYECFLWAYYKFLPYICAKYFH